MYNLYFTNIKTNREKSAFLGALTAPSLKRPKLIKRTLKIT